MVSELPKHASPADIRKGVKYRPILGKHPRVYKVLEINQSDTPQTSTLSYEVVGGPECGTKGNCSLAEFAERVRYTGK